MIRDDFEKILERFYEDVIRCNREFNLTAITDEKEFHVKHFERQVGLWVNRKKPPSSAW